MVSKDPRPNLCLKCEKYNLSCLYGQDTHAVGCSDFVERTEKSLKFEAHMIPMSVDSIRVSLMNYQRVVILKERAGEQYLPCWIGEAEADALAVKMQGVTVPRPLTHDFVCTIARELGGTIKYVIINDLKNDTFYAKTIIDRGDQQIEIDCRPSDALAIAIRTGIPIFVHDEVMKKAGIFLDAETGKPIEAPPGITIAFEDKTDKGRLKMFAESAQDILSLAENESKHLNQSPVNTEHLLLALVKQTNTASEILKNMDINLAKISDKIEDYLSKQANEETKGAELSHAVKRVIELSAEEAKRLGSPRIQPEHILVGIVRENESIAATLLRELGASLQEIYIQLIRLYTSGGIRN